MFHRSRVDSRFRSSSLGIWLMSGYFRFRNCQGMQRERWHNCTLLVCTTWGCFFGAGTFECGCFTVACCVDQLGTFTKLSAISWRWMCLICRVAGQLLKLKGDFNGHFWREQKIVVFFPMTNHREFIHHFQHHVFFCCFVYLSKGYEQKVVKTEHWVPGTRRESFWRTSWGHTGDVGIAQPTAAWAFRGATSIAVGLRGGRGRMFCWTPQQRCCWLRRIYLPPRDLTAGTQKWRFGSDVFPFLMGDCRVPG